MNYHKSMGYKQALTALGLGTKIISSGIYIPKQCVTSREIFESFDSEKKYDIPVDWMTNEMGIIQRYMCQPNDRPSDLAIPAAQQAMEGVNKDHIDCVIFCGIERDQPEPATAHQIQKKLGLNAGHAFDLANACFGFFDGLKVASSLVQSKSARLVLVVTGEITSKLTNIVVDQINSGLSLSEFRQKIGFLSVGDAGGAVVIGDSGDGGMSGFKSFQARTLSKHNDLCYYNHTPDGGLDAKMQMAKIVSRTIRLQTSIINDAQCSESWKKPKFLMTHQVGKRAFDQIADMAITPKDRMIKSYHHYGNVTSATFPLNYHQLINDNRLAQGDEIYGCYNGSGISAGQFSYTY